MRRNKLLIAAGTLSILVLLLALPVRHASARTDDLNFIAANSMLEGLAPGAAFPFIDTTPHTIVTAHIAITDATANCSPSNPTAPSAVQVLVGQAGVADDGPDQHGHFDHPRPMCLPRDYQCRPERNSRSRYRHCGAQRRFSGADRDQYHHGFGNCAPARWLLAGITRFFGEHGQITDKSKKRQKPGPLNA